SSFFEERVTFTQHDVFRLVSYRLIQTGPAFAQDLDASLAREGNHYRVVARSHPDGRERTWEGSMDLPPDLYNGMIIMLLKNLSARDTEVVHLLAFTPRPRMIELALVPAGRPRVLNGSSSETALLFDLKPKLGALVGFFAHVMG